MSVASAITARQMETWAHGQAIFDLVGVPRVDGDRLRNVADTSLEIRGETARHWMTIAQCFAGPPEDHPAPGTRFRAVTRAGRA